MGKQLSEAIVFKIRKLSQLEFSETLTYDISPLLIPTHYCMQGHDSASVLQRGHLYDVY
jgi:hypothetical protein